MDPKELPTFPKNPSPSSSSPHVHDTTSPSDYFNTNADSNIQINLNLNLNLHQNQNKSDTSTPSSHNTSKHTAPNEPTNQHRRGTESSLFNSDSTLVDLAPVRVPSNNSELSSSAATINSTSGTLSDVPTFSSLRISEENDLHITPTESGPNAIAVANPISTDRGLTTITSTPTDTSVTPSGNDHSGKNDYFASNSFFSNKGLLNRSKLHGLGHRTSKSETFTPKLPKKIERNPLNNLHEEIQPSSSTSCYFPLFQKTSSKNSFSFINQAVQPVQPQQIPQPPSQSSMGNNFFLSPTSQDFNFSTIRKSKTSTSTSLPSRSSIKFNNKDKLKIPPTVNLLRLEDAEQSIQDWSSSLGSDSLSNLLIIDVRPFHDYCTCHIINSINICLPSTLLKRSTFTLEKCIQTLTSKEKRIFSKYFQRDAKELPKVLLYDDFNSTENGISQSIFYLVGKFLQNLNWNSSLYVLEGGFTKFNERCSLISNNENLTRSAIENENDTINSDEIGSRIDTQKNIDINATAPHKLTVSSERDLSSASINSETFSPSTTNFSPHSLTSPGNMLIKHNKLSNTFLNTNFVNNDENNNTATSNNTILPNKSPIGLSRFSLPHNSHIPVFKTRNYDEIITEKPDLSIHLSNNLTRSEISTLPKWLSNVIGDDLGSSILTGKFNSLQIQERERLTNALTNKNYLSSETGSDFPIICSGVELGRKNRYKDIFLYEHARVKLQNANSNSSKNSGSNNIDADSDLGVNYINASYINYPRSKFNYIATQGPLHETIGDFWKMVYDDNVPLILSLTPQFENQIEKCAPFWNAGTFYSNHQQIQISLIEETDNFTLASNSLSNCVCRRLLVQIDNQTPKEVLQVQMTNWPDFGIVIVEEDILSVVSLKKYICEALNITDDPVVVHCSAGCGRTGSFCVIDTCIDILFNDEQNNLDESSDLIYDITSFVRSQRVFMVQTLRQYILIYDCVIKYLMLKANPNKQMGNDKLDSNGLIDWQYKDPGILNRFISSYRTRLG